jgi:hypothetical protein
VYVCDVPEPEIVVGPVSVHEAEMFDVTLMVALLAPWVVNANEKSATIVPVRTTRTNTIIDDLKRCNIDIRTT